MQNDYKAHLNSVRKTRLEKIALEVLKGLVVSKNVVNDPTAQDNLCRTSIEIAKEFINKIDLESF